MIILGVLMFASSTETAGSGRYADGQWEVSTRGRATDPQACMVTLHEIMHAGSLSYSTRRGPAVPGRLRHAGPACA